MNLSNNIEVDSTENRNNEDKDSDSGNQNNGMLQMDATIADTYIKFPTDLNLLNDSREKSEMLFDLFCKELEIEKPRTYRIKARKL